MNMESARTVLTAFNYAIEQQTDNKLSPKKANRLAAILGYSEKDLYTLAESLREQDLLEIQWGGNISLTQKAIEFLQPKTTANSIHLEPGAIYAPNAEKVLGHGAADHSISGVETGGGNFNVGDNNTVSPNNPIDHQQMQEFLSALVGQLDETNKAKGEALQRSITEISHHLEHPITSEQKPVVESELKKANGMLKQLGESSKNIHELLPYLQVAGTWLGVTAAKLFS